MQKKISVYQDQEKVYLDQIGGLSSLVSESHKKIESSSELNEKMKDEIEMYQSKIENLKGELKENSSLSSTANSEVISKLQESQIVQSQLAIEMKTLLGK